MRKLLMFFSGILLTLIALGSLTISAAIFDVGGRVGVTTYFFQPVNFSDMRLDAPVPVADLGRDKLLRMLIEKYVSEYFYIIPDADNVVNRMARGSVLYMMSTGDVFEEWKNGEGQVIEEGAANGWFRTVTVVGDIYRPDGSDWWTVTCDIATWKKTNDMSDDARPVVIRLELDVGLVNKDFTTMRPGWTSHLDADPAEWFNFGVSYFAPRQDRNK